MVYSFTRTWTHPLEQPKISLVITFFAWKLLLLFVAVSSPGRGYDTSTFLIQPAINTLIGNLVRWDAIYFTQAAQRNYLFEQEWAFSLVFSRAIRYLARGIAISKLAVPGDHEALAGIAIAHISHLGSVLTLYKLTKLLFKSDPKVLQIAVISASLHIISPAGIFLSAPYAESLFSLLQFSGYYFFVRGYNDGVNNANMTSGLDTLISGLLLGLATAIRSNGILSGALFAYSSVTSGRTLMTTWRKRTIQKLGFSVLGGILVALGAILPQFIAYQEYCTGPLGIRSRPWCQRLVPSVYSWVQSYYWNVGFLRYWTLSNIPLFLLAAPMLLCLTLSSMWAWSENLVFRNGDNKATHDKSSPPESEAGVGRSKRTHRLLIRLISVPQLTLAILALTSYHVQVITRLSSGYPLWYWWLASTILSERRARPVGASIPKPCILLRWMAIYAVIQGGLFASFLPPA